MNNVSVHFKVFIVIVSAALLPLVASAGVVNIGSLFPLPNPSFTQTEPGGMPAINSSGSVIGFSLTVSTDGSTEMSGSFRYSKGTMYNLGLGGTFAITDDGAVWGGFVSCNLPGFFIQRMDTHGRCTGLPSSFGATGLSVSPDGQWVLGDTSNGVFVAWQLSSPNSNTYAFYNLGAVSDPFTDSRFSSPSTFSATNINEHGEFAVTVSNYDASGNAFFHAYLYRITGGVAAVEVDLGPGVIANAINDLGSVAGLGPPLVFGSPQQPFTYSKGKVQTWDLSSISLSPGFVPTIVGLNDEGQSAFYVDLSSDQSTHSFLRQANGRLVDVGSIFPAGHEFNMIAVGLNNRGQITGFGADFTVAPFAGFYAWIFTP
jgi:hypothetical protein